MTGTDADNGWEASAAAWISDVGEIGDAARRYVLDPWMLAHLEGRGFRRALDVGCGEGRLCRQMQRLSIATTGVDPTRNLLARARELDLTGRYDEGRAEALPYADASFDLVVTCLTLVDIPDHRAAIAEMARVLEPGGALLMANLTSMGSSTGPRWVKDASGRKLHFAVDNYIEEVSHWEAWRGIRILNHHRPLSSYMQAFLKADLELISFDEPMPTADAPADLIAEFRRLPWFVAMEWRKPD